MLVVLSPFWSVKAVTFQSQSPSLQGSSQLATWNLWKNKKTRWNQTNLMTGWIYSLRLTMIPCLYRISLQWNGWFLDTFSRRFETTKHFSHQALASTVGFSPLAISFVAIPGGESGSSLGRPVARWGHWSLVGKSSMAKVEVFFHKAGNLWSQHISDIYGCWYTYFSELLMALKNADVADRCSSGSSQAVPNGCRESLLWALLLICTGCGFDWKYDTPKFHGWLSISS